MKSELDLVNSLNSFFEKNNYNAIAYRIKQSIFTGQFCDVLVDSEHSDFYLGIECKSINLKSAKKLYFSQHFHSNERNQIQSITEFFRKSGRKGFLALEVRRGAGHSNELFLIPWKFVLEKFEKKENIELETLSNKFQKINKKEGYYDFGQIFRQ